MPNKADSTINVRQVAERIWRARNIILLFQLAIVLLTVFVILFWPRTYSSTAQLYLQRGRESVGLDPTANATGKTIALQQAGRDSEINSAIDVLSSRGIIDPVVEKLGPAVVKGDESLNPSEDDRRPSPVSDAIKNGIGWLADQVRKVDPASYKERAIVEIEKNLVVDAERKSEIISVVYEADTPELAQAVVKSIVEEYKKKHSELHRTLGSTEFFDEQSERLRSELSLRNQKLRDAKNRMGLATIQGQRKILEEVQLSEVRMDMLNTEKSLYGARAKARNLAERLASLPARISAAETTKP
ncbi:MAG: Wzz/FepE/Etk N-terminal domain-containing protein, partial [Planctomycetota bacterium]